MRKILLVARRDFLATVSTKGFIIAIMVPPIIYGAIVLAFPRLLNNRVPAVTGKLAVIDPTGQVVRGVRSYLDPQAIASRRDASFNRAVGASPMAGAATGASGAAAQRMVLGEVPHLDIVESPPAGQVSEKDRLTSDGADRQLAVLVVHPNAVVPDADGMFGAYDLFVRRNLDNRIQNEIRNAAADAIIDARVRAAGLDRQRIDALTKVLRPPSVTVTSAGESATRPDFANLLPMGFTILLMISVMSSGQYLLTTTIEEKSSRTMEVILSAVSPLELLTGKILAQMAVGLTILVTYASMGILGLVSMAMLDLIDPSLVVYLFIFFLITYVFLGSLMAAIGSAVNELREAQSLMTPITLLIMIPWLLSFPISREPNSLFATVVSFIPPMNAFAMLLRLTSTSPPPLWQVWLSIAVGIVAAGGALWFASRIFKVGLLMHGRPPNFATLLKWARQA
jgi:ABC-2 type transport system permease protein